MICLWSVSCRTRLCSWRRQWIPAGRFAGAEHLRRAGELQRPVGKVLGILESPRDAATALSLRCLSDTRTAEAVVPAIAAARDRGANGRARVAGIGGRRSGRKT